MSLNFFIAASSLLAQANFLKQQIDTAFSGTPQPWWVQSADMDQDGDIDLILSVPDFSGIGEQLFFYPNDGNNFFTRTVIDSTLVTPYGFAISDFDQDQDNDLVLGTQNGIYLYTNDSATTFVKSLIDGGISANWRIVAGDLDADHDQDILILSVFGIFWEVNEGNLTFTRDTVDAIDIVDVGLFASDLDGDSLSDVVSAVYSNSNHLLVWYRNAGNGDFSKDTLDNMNQFYISDIVLKDLDQDNDMDILVALEEQNSILRYLNDGSETFIRDTLDATPGLRPVKLSIEDLEGDGDWDIICVGGTTTIGQVIYYENDGNSNFIKHIVDNGPGKRGSLQVNDVNQDSLPDLLVASRFPDELLLYMNEPVTNIADKTVSINQTFTLHQNYPNPFNPSTIITFELPKSNEVLLKIYNVLGEEVATLLSASLPSGSYQYEWDASGMASGVYLYRLQAGEYVETRKLVLMR
ncbi:MAG: hypothetical protein A2Y88_12030 [Chloroflexi bacterium RBG_13_48_10]|nr:MAG: hypothetical protein A2Y88_12030 [Chloroflexi bacterium RBG_13_48_10]